MAFLIIDRRSQGKQKNAVNRQRFLRRFRKHIKDAVADAVSKRSITDMDRGEEISIPRRDISEPTFRNGRGGRQGRVLPGNRDFVTGDRIRRPPDGGNGSGKGQASDQGEGVDEFVFELNQQEFLDFVFEDLELPNLVKKKLKDNDAYKTVKGGYLSEGIPARLNVVQSLKSAQARRVALKGAIKRELREQEQQLEALAAHDEERERELRTEIERLERRLHHIPFLDDFDLRYNNMIRQPVPSTSAVMFCLMDVSGSMTQDIKDLAKRFFILLHLFLKRHYEKTEVVFIRHHTKADEVDEDEFFYSRETGGTVVSSALQLMNEVIEDRYPPDSWNVFAAQASDGENWHDDSPRCRDLLGQSILPLTQYFAYVEINSGQDQELWNAYNQLTDVYPDSFAMRKVQSASDIFPVFRELFEKKST